MHLAGSLAQRTHQIDGRWSMYFFIHTTLLRWVKIANTSYNLYSKVHDIVSQGASSNFKNFQELYSIGTILNYENTGPQKVETRHVIFSFFRHWYDVHKDSQTPCDTASFLGDLWPQVTCICKHFSKEFLTFINSFFSEVLSIYMLTE